MFRECAVDYLLYIIIWWSVFNLFFPLFFFKDAFNHLI